MTILKNPFGLRDGKIVMIEDISLDERGLKCNCVCPACKDPFEARLGDVRTHHFAHSGEGCDEEIAFLNGMYMLVQEFILANAIVLPKLRVYWKYYESPYTEQNFFERIRFSDTDHAYGSGYSIKAMNSIDITSPKEVQFSSAETVLNGKRPVAIILTYRSRQMALCIRPPSTVCKAFQVKPYDDMATIELDASDVTFGEMTKEEILESLRKALQHCIWVYSPKAITVIEIINAQNAEWIRYQQEERQRREQIEHEQLEEKERERQEQQRHIAAAMAYAARKNEDQRQKGAAENEQKHNIELKKGLLEIRDRFSQQVEIIRDSFGQRWIQCERCGEIKPDYEFSFYGGKNSVNLGICRDCSKQGHFGF